MKARCTNCDAEVTRNIIKQECHSSPCPVGAGGWSNSTTRPECTCATKLQQTGGGNGYTKDIGHRALTQDCRTCPHCFNLVCTKCDCKCHITQDWKEEALKKYSKTLYGDEYKLGVDEYNALSQLLKEEREIQEKLREIAINNLITDVNNARKEERNAVLKEVLNDVTVAIESLKHG